MRKFVLVICCVCSVLLTQAQVPQPGSPKLLSPDNTEATPGPGTPQASPTAADPIEQQLDGFIKTYRYPNPTSSPYDTLLHNTRGYAADEVPTFSAQQIADRLYSLPTVIPMDYNRHVARYINVYTKRRRDQMSRMLGLADVYFPLFEEALDREQLPIEIKYLAVVESALNPHARSRVGATGLWQFMLGTGRIYGLKVNSFVDERRDPHKSTAAAVKYLKNAYAEFGDWLLAIASYNCGPGNVRKAIRRSGGKRNFWEIMPYLPRETRGYVPAFVAVNYAFTFASEHNIYPIYPDYDLRGDSLHIRHLDITLAEIAQMTKSNVEVLRYLNPELQLDRIPYSEKPYILRVPAGVAVYFAANERDIRTKYGKKRDATPPQVTLAANRTYKPRTYSPPAGTKLYYHTVQSGEVVGQIAERWGVSTRAIANWNNLYRYRIKVGQKLKIYTTPSRAVAAKRYKPAPQTPSAPTSLVPSGGKSYTVRSGDTLWDIAKRNNTSVSQLTRLNPGLSARNLKVGQKIRVE